jgi:hypothetical protein
MRRTLVALAAALMLSTSMVGGPSEALAAPQQADGVVVVQIGDVSDVLDVNVAAGVIAQVCGVQALNGLNVLNILTRIDQQGGQATFCKTGGNKVTAKNN